jgi:hypothetical protein
MAQAAAQAEVTSTPRQKWRGVRTEHTRSGRRRKEAYESKHPETRNGATGGGHTQLRQLGEAADRFTVDTAKKTGQSERAVRERKNLPAPEAFKCPAPIRAQGFQSSFSPPFWARFAPAGMNVKSGPDPGTLPVRFPPRAD